MTPDSQHSTLSKPRQAAHPVFGARKHAERRPDGLMFEARLTFPASQVPSSSSAHSQSAAAGTEAAGRHSAPPATHPQGFTLPLPAVRLHGRRLQLLLSKQQQQQHCIAIKLPMPSSS